MAYRKKARKASKRRGRVGASPRKRGVNITKVAGLIAGAAAGSVIAKLVEDRVENDNASKIAAAGVGVLGFMLPKFVKGDLAASAGDGLLAYGGLRLLQDFNVLNGIPFVAGWQDMKLINGPGKVAGTSGDLTKTAAAAPFRPTMSQVMNGVYRRSYDR